MSRKKLRILVVDDEAAMREVLEMRLKQWGYAVRVAKNGAEALELATSWQPDAVLSDVVLPDTSGLELVHSLQDEAARRPIILITAFGTIDAAVEAMKQGALDFLTKPLDYEKLRASLHAATQQLARTSSARALEARLEQSTGLGDLVGGSPLMREVYELLQVLADSDASAILSGESGTGKELAAQTIHQLSARRNGPFIAVNTAAIADGVTESELFGHEKGAFTGAVASRSGYFELADGGTLFLDEIGEMPAALQPKLLRVLEDGKVRRVGGSREKAVDVRMLAATNRDPAAIVKSGRLREDLYYRLNVFSVELPPLRRRVQDVGPLAQHSLHQFNAKHGTAVEGIAGDVLEIFEGYAWPGNVRELRNVMERAVILARDGWVETLHLPPFLHRPAGERAGDIVLPVGVTVAEAEKRLILETLRHCGNNKSQAARTLAVDVKTIRNKLRSYGAEAETD